MLAVPWGLGLTLPPGSVQTSELGVGPAAPVPPDACPRRQVFPRGLPPEFTLVLTLLLKKNSTGEHWYLFQVTDRQGYPQV